MHVITRTDGRVVVPPPDPITTPGPGIADQPITIIVDDRAETRVVRIAGELDVASREVVTRSCTDGGAKAVTVDLSELTFLDCAGYGTLVAARTILTQRRGTLVLVGAVGEPRRLLDLIDPGGSSC